LVNVALWPSVLVTTTFTAPAVCVAVVAVIEELLTTLMLVAAVPPKVTPAADWNPVPLMVTGVPPAVVPDVGEMALTVGGGSEPCLPPRKVATCITQAAELVVAVAL
jgi:hypothetical protein